MDDEVHHPYPVHAALDYGVAATLLTAPHLLGTSTRAKVFFEAFGALATTVNALTRTPLAVRPVLSLRAHRTADLLADPLYLALPLVTGIAKEPRARALWLATAAMLAASVALTDWDAPEPV
ncbi:hypothetical protein [Cellulomonas marina]|uniref:Uncharacterized protein n=1 Tax=Cellulomonas marina TaxID=988821 RepID=A0A1I0ZJ26_9CELL|nr:hypothetical protein [Cellulomonas marina]GIG28539.1 hypothetical protein Cma02nite_11390 [Cellulomonas marina]SFB24530.1 hypothetical protein SAMN05421867_11125 [Cellulomonas marina]